MTDAMRYRMIHAMLPAIYTPVLITTTRKKFYFTIYDMRHYPHVYVHILDDILQLYKTVLPEQFL